MLLYHIYIIRRMVKRSDHRMAELEAAIALQKLAQNGAGHGQFNIPAMLV